VLRVPSPQLLSCVAAHTPFWAEKLCSNNTEVYADVVKIYALHFTHIEMLQRNPPPDFQHRGMPGSNKDRAASALDNCNRAVPYRVIMYTLTNHESVLHSVLYMRIHGIQPFHLVRNPLHITDQHAHIFMVIAPPQLTVQTTCQVPGLYNAIHTYSSKVFKHGISSHQEFCCTFW
jgi:hypothetical protein